MGTLIEIWKNKGKIYEGIKNKIFKKAHVEEVAQSRMVICINCRNYDPIGTNCAVPGTAPCCSVCGCCLQFLVRSLSSECEAGYWPAVLTEKEEKMLTKSTEDDTI